MWPHASWPSLCHHVSDAPCDIMCQGHLCHERVCCFLLFREGVAAIRPGRDPATQNHTILILPRITWSFHELWKYGTSRSLWPETGDLVRTTLLCVTSVYYLILVGAELEMGPFFSRVQESILSPRALGSGVCWADTWKVTRKCKLPLLHKLAATCHVIDGL